MTESRTERRRCDSTSRARAATTGYCCEDLSPSCAHAATATSRTWSARRQPRPRSICIYAESHTHRRGAPPISYFVDRSNLRNDSALGSERARSPSFCPTDQPDRMIRNSCSIQETNDHRRADFGRRNRWSKFRHPDQLRDPCAAAGGGASRRGTAAPLGLDGGLRFPRSVPAWRRSR
jgi:hypothetical protein